MKKLIAICIAAWLLQGWTTQVFADGNIQKGKVIFNICVACHEENGEGNKTVNAPRISGQHDWYLERQLNNFREGLRGYHFDDINGLTMRPMALVLKAEKDIADVVAYISTLRSDIPGTTLQGDMNAGKLSFQTCVACHGADGRGNQQLNAPNIAGLADWYVARQLKNFRQGIRGGLQKDLTGQQMRPMALPIDDATINNLAVYVASLGGGITEVPVATAETETPAETVSGAAVQAGVEPISLEVEEPLYAPCAACHGANGGGSQRLGAPRISGQHAWYVERQLKNWQNGIRGTHPEDLYGMQMRPMSMTLPDEDAVAKVAAYISGLESPTPAPTVKGDSAAGKTLFAVCVACHGPDGQGNQALNAPKIAGLPDWYVVRQLQGFKKGLRGENPRDLFGLQMRPMALGLADEEAVNNVAAYIATLSDQPSAPAVAAAVTQEPETEVETAVAKEEEESVESPAAQEPSAAVETAATEPAVTDTSGVSPGEGDADAGKDLFATCLACHGIDGAGNQALNSPRIAGQEDWYLRRQLKNFRAGYRGANAKDAFGQQMRPMAMALADDLDIEDVVAYIGTLQGEPSPPALDGNADAGKPLYTVCVACHGADGRGNPALNAPNLTGLQDWYIVRQLKNFKEGVRGVHLDDTFGQQMRPMALTLPDENAIKNVAAYIISLR